MALDRDDHDERQARIEQMMRENCVPRPFHPAKATLKPRRRHSTAATTARKPPRRK